MTAAKVSIMLASSALAPLSFHKPNVDYTARQRVQQVCVEVVGG